MSSSKIFLGDLPEITNKIIPYLCHDYSTLHSCILVNRLWCRLAIPLLWEDPFSFPTKDYTNLIKIYLCNLNENDKTKLNEHGINYKLFNTLFNYPSFIKYLDTCKIFNCIHAKKRASSYRRLIYKALLKTFIESGARLHALILNDSCIDEHFKDFFELILQSPNFIHNIESLNLDIGNRNIRNRNNNVILNKIITLLSSNSNLISILVTHSNTENCSQIIKSQQNLQKITFFNNYSLNRSLLSLKNSNCSNTLKTIIFSEVNFRNIVILNEVFEQLNVLESVHILNCFSLDFHFVQQIINTTKQFKLKTLVMTGESLQVESLQLLLQTYGHYLENIGLTLLSSGQPKQQLFELITKYCTNIKFFDLRSLIESNIYLGLDLIKNIGPNLNYLSITGCNGSSIILQELGQILPFNLEYLSLVLYTFNISDFEIFLRNSQHTYINTLLIRIVNEGESILPYVEEYIMKEKRVKHLALKVVKWDLIGSKQIVKKFKLYNIIVQSYFDLCIDYSDYKKSKMFQNIFD